MGRRKGSTPAKTNAERQQAYRDRLKAEGGERLARYRREGKLRARISYRDRRSRAMFNFAAARDLLKEWIGVDRSGRSEAHQLRDDTIREKLRTWATPKFRRNSRYDDGSLEQTIPTDKETLQYQLPRLRDGSETSSAGSSTRSGSNPGAHRTDRSSG